MGTVDGRPSHYGDAALSRVCDLLWYATVVGGIDQRQKVWETLPHVLRFDYVWSTWTYTRT